MQYFRGEYHKAIELGEESARLGRRALDLPVLATQCTTLAEFLTIEGQHERAKEYLAEAEALFERTQSWSARVLYYLDNAGIALMQGNVSLALRFAAQSEELSVGRGGAFLNGGELAKFKTFRVAHQCGTKAAIDVAVRACEVFRGGHPLYLIDALAALSWAERKDQGRASDETLDELRALLRTPSGKARELLAQGFLEELP